MPTGKDFQSMPVVAMLSCKGSWWGVHDNDDGKEEVVEVDVNDETIVASGGGGRQKGGSVCN